MNPGIHPDVPEVDYHRDTGTLSASGAKLILKAPALFKWRLEHPEETNNFDVGHASHAKVLGVGGEVVIVQQTNAKTGEQTDAADYKSTSAREHRDALRAEGKVPLLAWERQRCDDMYDVLTQHTLAMELLSEGRAEVTICAEDQATGTLRRGRIDWLRDDGGFVDYKTSNVANPHAFARSHVAQYGYHVSEANYRYILARQGIQVPWAALVVQEKEPPYLVEVIELDSAAVARGYELMARACAVYRACVESGDWPGYTARKFTTVSLPNWAFYDDDTAQLALITDRESA